MFLSLLLVTILLAGLISALVALLFTRPLTAILNRIVSDEIGGAWVRYMQFAIMVAGISGGVAIYQLEKYITAPSWTKDAKIVELTGERWVLELYRTGIGTLQSIAWLLLVFFSIALIAYVIVRFGEMRWAGKAEPKGQSAAGTPT